MLKNNDICLRAVKNSDISTLYTAINNPEIIQFNAAFQPIHERNHLKWFDSLANDKTKTVFIIEWNNTVVGSVQLIDINQLHKNAELTIRLFDSQYFGKGIGHKAVELMCTHAFKNLGLVRVFLRVFEDNIRAINSYKKAKFQVEGVMRRSVFINGEFKNMVFMSRLNDA